MNKRVHVIITGRVQGVCFRMETKREANKFDVSGWVRNKNDGTVEALFEGEKKDVNSLVDWCYQGPLGASVQDVNIKLCNYKGEFQDFTIDY